MKLQIKKLDEKVKKKLFIVLSATVICAGLSFTGYTIHSKKVEEKQEAILKEKKEKQKREELKQKQELEKKKKEEQRKKAEEKKAEEKKKAEQKKKNESAAEKTSQPKPNTSPSNKKTSKPSSFNGVGHYSDNGVTIDVVREWYGNAYVYAAHIKMNDYSRLQGEYLGGQYLSSAAHRNNAILAINGDWASPNGYTEIRGGKVIVKSNMPEAAYSASNGLLWYGQNGYEGATETFCFGPAFLINGAVTGPSGGGRAQRTFIGTNGNPGDLWLCVSDGRYNDGQSAGLTPYECAKYLKSKGCSFGVPLDGGGSSEMIFKGEILNGAKHGERALNDALYIK